MKPLTKYLIGVLIVVISISCTKEENDAPVPSYTIPQSFDELKRLIDDPEWVNKFTSETGMTIANFGDLPLLFYGTFDINHKCIYDSAVPNNEQTTYSLYTYSLNHNNDGFDSMSYETTQSTNYQDIAASDSTGFQGIGTGNTYTITTYFKAHGTSGNVTYTALWIVTGNATFGANFNITSFDNAHSCLIMLSKGSDPDNRVAQPGTVRVFVNQ